MEWNAGLLAHYSLTKQELSNLCWITWILVCRIFDLTPQENPKSWVTLLPLLHMIIDEFTKEKLEENLTISSNNGGDYHVCWSLKRLPILYILYQDKVQFIGMVFTQAK